MNYWLKKAIFIFYDYISEYREIWTKISEIWDSDFWDTHSEPGLETLIS